MSRDQSTVTTPERPKARAAGAPEPRPFDWTALPRAPRAEIDLLHALGVPPGAAGVLSDIAADLGQDLGVPVTLRLERVGVVEPVLPAPGCLASVELGPLPGRIVADIDLGLALAAADRLLGGEGTRPPVLRVPTAIERGVLSHLLLRALARLDLAWMREAGLRPRLSGISDAAPSIPGSAVEVAVAASLGGDAGTVRVLVPQALARAPALGPGRRGKLPGPLRGVTFALAVEVGGARFTAAELATLSPRDVLVLERAPMRLEGGRLAGEVRLRIPGARGILVAVVSGDDRGWRLSVGAYRIEGGATMEGEKEPRGGEPREGERLLGDVQIPVTVELGRLTLTVEEIAALRAGDTLLLGRAPGAPLDLAAGGKVIAKGELVDVEGEIGFRVLTLG